MEAEAVDGRLKEAEAKEKLTAVASLDVILDQTWFQHGPNMALEWSQNVDTINMSLIQ